MTRPNLLASIPVLRVLAVLVVLAALGAVTASLPASAATYLVQPDGTGDFPTIAAALAAAQPGDVVQLGSGTFTGPGNRDLSFGGKAITVTSVAANAGACVIDVEGSAASPHRAFSFTSGEPAAATLSHVTLRGGYISPGGGAIYVDGASPTLDSCVFEANTAHGGGAVWVYNGAHPLITNCQFLGNQCTGQNGGALLIGQASDPQVESCLFAGNASAAFGGAVLCYLSSEPVFVDCDFLDNTAPSTGGAVYLGWDSHAEFDGCLFAGNESVLGGGAVRCYENSDPLFVSSTFCANTGEYGGALYVTDTSHPFLENCIVAFSLVGEGVHLANGGQATLACCDLYGNEGGDWVGAISDQLGIAGNFSSDPLFCDAESYDCSLQENSPCTPTNNPGCGLIGAGGVGCGTQGIGEDPVPGAILRTYAMPNPARGGVEIHYELGAGAWAAPEIAIYDPTGRLVRTLAPGTPGNSGASGTSGMGERRVTWDGTDDDGRPVEEGVYFYRVRLGREIVSRHLVMLR